MVEVVAEFGADLVAACIELDPATIDAPSIVETPRCAAVSSDALPLEAAQSRLAFGCGAVKIGRSRIDTTPGSAAQTAGIAFTTLIAVPVMPAVL